MAKQYIDVLIDGKVYSLGGSETEGYVQQIATYLNGKIFQLKAQPGFLKMPEDYQSIMTYLNLEESLQEAGAAREELAAVRQAQVEAYMKRKPFPKRQGTVELKDAILRL